MDPFDLRKWKGFVEAGGNPAVQAIVEHIHIDTRRIDSPKTLFVALKGSVADGHDYVGHAAKLGARFSLVRKGFLPPKFADEMVLLYVDEPLKAFQEIVAEYRKSKKCFVIAITGSFGKTMVKDLLFDLVAPLKKVVRSPESFNSQIGVPLSLLKIKHEHEIAIIETAVSQKDEMAPLVHMIQPQAALLTPIGKKHSVGACEVVRDEFLKLFLAPSLNGWKLVPKDIPFAPLISPFFWNEAYPHLPHARKLGESFGTPEYEITFPDQTQVTGKIQSGFAYFIDLLNMAAKAAWLLGARPKEIIAALEHYTPDPWRTEIWRSPLGVTFINDTYSSDPQSVDSGLKHFLHTPQDARKIVFFGGFKNRGTVSDYKRVAHSFLKEKIDRLYLYGDGFETLTAELNQIPFLIASNYQEALAAYHKELKERDFVLIKGSRKEPIDLLTTEFNDSICTNQCFINLAAIKANIELIRKRLPPKSRLMVIVKALAYGMDETRVARFLASAGVDILGVSFVDEGIALRRAGITQNIFVISAAPFEVAKVVKWGLEVGASAAEFIALLAEEAKKQKKTIKVHLHVDTGMGRFGCRPEEAFQLAQMIHRAPSLKLEGMMTHFACADDPLHDTFTLNQAATFEKVVKDIETAGISIPWKHAANSAAIARFNFPAFNMARIGLAAYGLYASPATEKALELRLAVSLISRIVGINVCKAGESISYGRNYKVEKEEQRIAVLPIGYFDGIHRAYSGKGSVIIRGKAAPMVGNICMDFMMVDVTHIPQASVGDPVLVFGEDDYGNYLSPEDLAYQGGSIVYELITCLGPRIQRIFVNEESQTVR